MAGSPSLLPISFPLEEIEALVLGARWSPNMRTRRRRERRERRLRVSWTR